MSYATATDLWSVSLPPLSLFQDGRLTRGVWSAPARAAGSGGGVLQLDPASNPRDAYSVKVRCPVAGEVPVPGEVAFVGLPSLEVSLDGGNTWAPARQPDAQGRFQVLDAPVPATFSKMGLPSTGGGFTLVLGNGPPGAAVTFGSGNASLVVRAVRGGLSLKVVVGAQLDAALDQQTGEVLVTVATTTTAAAAAAYLYGSGMPVVVAAGGNGSGVVQAAAVQALPFAAFAVDDVWTFTTSPSPDVVMALEVESDLLRGYLRDTLTGADPLATWGAGVVGITCDKTRWRLIQRAGLGADKDMQVYYPKDAREWQSDVADGTIQPTVTEQGPERRFPAFAAQPDPLAGVPI